MALDDLTNENIKEPNVYVGIFAMLIKGHSALISSDRKEPTAGIDDIRMLLEGFSQLQERVSASDHLQSAEKRRSFGELLAGYDAAFEIYRRRQEERADDFNILDVLQVTYKEIRHSMVLAWLLDHDIQNLGTHAQGSLGFRLLLHELGLPMDYASQRYQVRREVSGDESIVDIEISCRDRFLIQIENKIRAGEGTDQTNREWADIQRRAAELGLDSSHSGTVHALFLSPHGTKPACPHFRAIGWGRVVRALEFFATQANPIDVRLFAAHYARALRRFVVMNNNKTEERDGNRNIE